MSARLFSEANWVPTATADTANLGNATYMAIQGAAGTQRTNVLEVFIQGESTASAVSYLQLAHDSQIAVGMTALAAPNSDGPQDPSTGALGAPVVSFVAQGTTFPQRAATATLSRLRLSLNCFGGIIKWNPWQPNMAFSILGNTASNGEASLSAFTGSSGSAQVSSHIIYETA
jgi:hypothetical protein